MRIKCQFYHSEQFTYDYYERVDERMHNIPYNGADRMQYVTEEESNRK